MTYSELQAALKVLGLNEGATLGEIKRRHRELVKRHHPDGRKSADSAPIPAARRDQPHEPSGESEEESDQALIRRINVAHRIISEYINSYQFSFSEEEFYRQNPEARLLHQFDNDPIWGPGGQGKR